MQRDKNLLALLGIEPLLLGRPVRSPFVISNKLSRLHLDIFRVNKTLKNSGVKVAASESDTQI